MRGVYLIGSLLLLNVAELLYSFELRFLFATDEVLDELRTRLETVVRQGVRVLTYNYSAAWHLGCAGLLGSLESHRDLLYEDF
jgi:hypothetical protein